MGTLPVDYGLIGRGARWPVAPVAGGANKRTARAWLNSPHPDLGEETPLEVMLSGHADAVVGLLENAIAGLPS